MQRLSKFFALAAISLTFAVHGAMAKEADIDIPAKYGDLGARVGEYYRAEKEKNWAKAWEFRVPLYRSSVPKDTFVAGMQKDTQGWSTSSYSLREFKEDGPCVLLKLVFVETKPNGSRVEIEDLSLWEKIDGIWQAWETGTRSYLSLNGALVTPNQTSKGSPSSCKARA